MINQKVQLPLFVHAICLLGLFSMFSKYSEADTISSIFYAGFAFAVASIGVTQLKPTKAWLGQLQQAIEEIAFPLCATITCASLVFMDILDPQYRALITSLIASVTIGSFMAYEFLSISKEPSLES